MKSLTLLLAAWSLPLFAYAAEPAPTTTSRIAGAEYICTLPIEGIHASPRWKPEQPLPIGFAQAAQMGRLELVKITKSLDGWTFDGINLNPYGRNETDLWTMTVCFSKPVPPELRVKGGRAIDSFYLLVDFAGHPGVIRPKEQVATPIPPPR